MHQIHEPHVLSRLDEVIGRIEARDAEIRAARREDLTARDWLLLQQHEEQLKVLRRNRAQLATQRTLPRL